MNVTVMDGRRPGVIQLRLSDWQNRVIIAVVACGVMAALYWPIVSIDAGWLQISDDKALIASIEGGILKARFRDLHGHHFIPAMRFFYYLLYAPFGTWWPPYGAIMIAAQSALVIAIGLVVYRFGGSLPAALSVMLPVAFSPSLAIAILTGFNYAPLALMMAMIIVIPLLVQRYVCRPTLMLLCALFLLMTWCLLTIVSGGIAHIYVGLVYAGLRLAQGRPWRLTREDVGLAGAIVLSVGLYLLLYLGPLISIGWRLPTDMEFCQSSVVVPQWARLLWVLTYAYADSWSWYVRVTDVVGLEVWGAIGGAATALMIVVPVALLATGRVASSERRTALVCLAACFGMAVLVSVMLISGRSCLSLFHGRYTMYPIAFLACGVGILIGVALAALPARLRPVLAAILVAGSIMLALQEIDYVRGSGWWERRMAGVAAMHGSPMWLAEGNVAEPRATAAVSLSLPR